MQEKFKWFWRNMRLYKDWYGPYIGQLVLRLRTGQTIRLRKRGDLAVVWEVYGQESYRAIRETNPKIIVDLGAHIGTFTLYAHHLFPNAEIHAYEPAGDLYPHLIANVGAFAHTYKKAVAGHQRTATLHLDNSIGIQNSLYPIESHGEHVRVEVGTEEVDCIAFDSIVEQLGHIDFLKIDIEDAEIELLEESRLLDRVSVVVVEGNEKTLLALLHDKGFHARVFTRGIVLGTR